METFGIVIPGPTNTFSIIQETGTETDDMGGIKPHWEIYFTVTDGAYFEDKLGSYEERRTGAETAVSVHSFVFYYNSAYTVTEKMKVRYNGVDYDIFKVEVPQGVFSTIEVQCKEINK